MIFPMQNVLIKIGVSLNLLTICFTLNAQQSVLNIMDTIGIEEVIVTGAKTEVTRDYVPASISIISTEKIKRNCSYDILPSISENAPGVFSTSRGIGGYGVAGGSAGKITIRGLSSENNQVLVLVDGHPQYMGIMGHPMPDAYISHDTKKVEIIRGPASMLYGSHAMGGVINIITTTSQKDGLSIYAGLSVGSFNTQNYSSGLAYKKNKLMAQLSAHYFKTNNHRDSANYESLNGLAKFSYKINKSISLNAISGIASYTTADPGPESIHAGDTANIIRGNTSLTLNYLNGISNGSIQLYYNYGQHEISSGWVSNDMMWGMMVSQVFNVFYNNEITLGYDYIEFGGKATNGLMDTPFFNTWFSSQEHAAYAMVKQRFFEEVILNAGLRYNYSKAYNGEWIPEIGASWHITNNSILRTNIGKGYRTPSIKELYFFGTANPELNPESINSYELGYKQSLFQHKISTDLTVYKANGSNLIVSEFTGVGLPPKYMNSGRFNNSGIELSACYRIIENFLLEGNYSYINMEKKLPSTPEHSFFLSANYGLGKWNFMTKIQHLVNLYGLDANSAINIIEENYTVLGARVDCKLNSLLSLFVSGDNLLNTKYAINYDYPMPGLTVFSGLLFSFNSNHKRK